MIGRQAFAGTLGPLDEDERARRHDLVPAQVRQLLWRVETKEIDVKVNRARRLVLLNQGICWTGDFFFDAVAPAGSLGQSGLPYSQLTGKRNDERRRNRAAQLFAPVTKLFLGDLEVALVSARR